MSRKTKIKIKNFILKTVTFIMMTILIMSFCIDWDYTDFKFFPVTVVIDLIAFSWVYLFFIANGGDED